MKLKKDLKSTETNLKPLVKRLLNLLLIVDKAELHIDPYLGSEFVKLYGKENITNGIDELTDLQKAYIDSNQVSIALYLDTEEQEMGVIIRTLQDGREEWFESVKEKFEQALEESGYSQKAVAA